jgi:L-alanine-DL-glutamate epimerase-like enolase superfamily enzyme
MDDVAAIDTVLIEHELTMPFTIAGGGMDSARAVITRVELVDGTVGLGESAPFPAVSGETVETTSAALAQVARDGMEALAAAPAARCGLEQALLDARLRSAGESVGDWMPPVVTTVETDITLPVCPVDDAMAFVDDAVRQGFRALNVKVGGHALADDVDLLRSIHRTFPPLELLLDGNGAYDLATARELLQLLAAVPIVLLEQPLGRDALDDMAALQATTDVVICLDESLRDGDDLTTILRRPGLRCINIKTMKLGLHLAVDVLARAADAGLTCMIGGMVESRLSMTFSAALAMHRPDTIRYIDLDTPLFMRPGPITGGIVYDGPTISLPPGLTGHGCSLR